MAKKRRLSDLFILEKVVKIDDGKGPVEVLVRKMNPVDHELAFRKASAARSRIAAQRFDEGSEEFASFYDEAMRLDKQVLVEGIAAEKIEAERAMITERLTYSDAWSKDEYLQGLYDAWEDELKNTYAKDPEDPEALRVKGELDRFMDCIQDELDTFIKELYSTLNDREIEDLAKTYTGRLMRLEGDMRWISEYRKSSIWLMILDPETRKPYFSKREEVDILAQEVLVELVNAIENLEVEVMEGKDSGETQPSSDSSDQPEQPEAE